MENLLSFTLVFVAIIIICVIESIFYTNWNEEKNNKLNKKRKKK